MNKPKKITLFALVAMIAMVTFMLAASAYIEQPQTKSYQKADHVCSIGSKTCTQNELKIPSVLKTAHCPHGELVIKKSYELQSKSMSMCKHGSVGALDVFSVYMIQTKEECTGCEYVNTYLHDEYSGSSCVLTTTYERNLAKDKTSYLIP